VRAFSERSFFLDLDWLKDSNRQLFVIRANDDRLELSER